MKENRKRILSFLLVLVMVIGFFPAPAYAAGETVPVQFICTDGNGETVIPYVTVYDSNGEVVSQSKGYDHLLAPGSYTFTAEADGYQTVEKQTFDVQTLASNEGSKRSVSFTMIPEGGNIPETTTENAQSGGQQGNPEAGTERPESGTPAGQTPAEPAVPGKKDSITVSIGQDEEKRELLQIQVKGGVYPDTDPVAYKLLEQDETLKEHYMEKLAGQLEDESGLKTQEITRCLSLVVVENNEDKKPVTLRQPDPKDPKDPREPVQLAVSGEWMARFDEPVFAAWTNDQFDLITAERDEDGVWHFEAPELSLLMIVELGAPQPRTFPVTVNFVDEEGAELLPAETLQLPVSEEERTELLSAPVIEGYAVLEETRRLTVPALQTEAMTAALVYVPGTTLTIYYVDALDQAMAETEVRPLPVLDKEQTITLTAPEVEGYVADEETLTLTVPANQTEPVLHRVLYKPAAEELSMRVLSDDAELVTVEGMLPEGVTVAVRPLTEEEITELALEDFEISFAYDISLWLDGEKYEPAEEVSVRINMPELPAEDFEVRHFETDEEGKVGYETLTPSVTDEAATFKTEGFTPFVGGRLRSGASIEDVTVGGVTVHVEDPKDVLPAGAKLVVTALSNEDTIAAKAATDKVLGDQRMLEPFHALDISFTDDDDNPIALDDTDDDDNPIALDDTDGTISVVLSGEAIAALESTKAKLYHIGLSDAAYPDSELKATSVDFTLADGKLSFMSKDFSPFAMGNAEAAYTITINYVYEDGTEAAPTYTEKRLVSTEASTFTRANPAIEDYFPAPDPLEFDIPAGNTENITKTVTYKGDTTGAKLTATITSGSDVYELDKEGSNTLTMGWRGGLTLNVTAEFGAGTEKIVEIKIPTGMSFRYNYNSIYAVNGTDATLKEKVNPNKQKDADKKNVTVLGLDQYNGTITLKFHGRGEENDAKKVSFSVPLRTAWSCNYNSEVWESGTAWFYDTVENPVTVTQIVNKNKANEVKLGTITITNDNGKRVDDSWTATYNPEVVLDGSTSGNEYFRVQNIPNGVTYPNQTAYSYYSVTYLAPAGTEFVKFNYPSGVRCGNYKGAARVETSAGSTTPDGYEVPAGKKAFTWTISNAILTTQDTLVYPVWHFPGDVFPNGSTAPITVVDWKIRYYGRTYEDGVYETVPDVTKATITYEITDKYEEVFVNLTYQSTQQQIKDNNGKRPVNGYESDSKYNLYMGAPGFEHTQEREGGYYLIGNRGIKDSKPKTFTYTFDVNNTGYIGVTQMELPSQTSSKYSVSNIQYKVWKPAGGTVSDWMTYSGTANTVNISDAGYGIGDGWYLKEVKFDIDKVPKESYLKTGTTSSTNGNGNYYYYCVVLSTEQVAQGLNSAIKNTLDITNTNGNDDPPGGYDKTIHTDTATCQVQGRAFNGLQGKSIMYANDSQDYSQFSTSIQVGTDTAKQATFGLFHHAWTTLNAQYVDKLYLISPFGEEYTDIQMHYGKNGIIPVKSKQTSGTTEVPQPVIREVTTLSAELLAKYPKARLYELDFTGITDAYEMYNARMIGGNVMTAKSLSTPLTDNTRTGIWVTFKLKPDISDPTGTYKDLIWVKWHTDTDVGIVYTAGGYGSSVYSDSYNLTGETGARVGRLTQSLILTPTEGLEVASAAKQKNEVDSWYRTYDGTETTVMGIYSDANFRLSIVNQSSLPANGLTVYWPVPKTGENWGSSLTPKGAANYSLSLSNALREVPEGYEVYYAQNVVPNSQYATWENNTWVAQADTSSWGTADWNKVNFVKLKWVGTEDTPTINYGEDSVAVFDIRVDTTTTTAEQMYTLDVWQPYFLREYTASSSWVAGKPAAARLTPGRIAGIVWADQKKNSTKDNFERLVPGVTVQLYDMTTGEAILRAVATTDANGAYEFDGLRDGTAESGGIDTCKIVVLNPTDPEDTTNPDRYVTFSDKIDGRQMMFTGEADNKSAVLITDTRTENREANLKLDCGLVPLLTLGDLVVEKTLNEWESSGPATFVFNIEAKLDNITAYTNVCSLTFSGAGTQSYTFTEVIPVGAVVTVEEVYTGAVYKPDGNKTVTVTVEKPTGDPEPATASFTNIYENHERHGSGILNTFTKNRTGWDNSNDLATR